MEDPKDGSAVGEDDKDNAGGALATNNLSSDPVSVPCVLVPGENVSHRGTTRDCQIIILTNYRIHVSSVGGGSQEVEDYGSFINVPLSCIELVEARDLFFIHILCKDARHYRVSFGDNATCEDWLRHITNAVNLPSSIEESFAYTHYRWALEAQFEELEEENIFCANQCDTFRHEVSRLGFDLSASWRITSINKDLNFCATYPTEILVPACISDQVLEKVASFRSAKRVPAVVWRHKNSGAVLARCSQPEVGWLGWRSADDEDLVRAIADASAYDQPNLKLDLNCSESENTEGSIEDGVPSLKDLSAEVAAAAANSSKVLIVDARSYPAAVGNRARGGGVECIEYYPFAEIIFMSLGNIHNIRKSFQALRSLCNQTPADFSGGAGWLAALDATKWLYHTSGLLKAATRVASALHTEGRPVLVHCSDGWDRTPQIVSLAQLMLDPYYRSIDGFRTLVEICWLDFGHKMADRNGTANGGIDPNERAPIFLQWLDCVHQLLLQFPCHFEFNLSFLVKLVQHTYSSLFGTFLCNSLFERRRCHVSTKTRSVWDYLDHHHVKFRNFLYENHRLSKQMVVDPLWPRCEIRDLLLWKDIYVDVSELKVGPAVNSQLASASSTTNNTASASSSGMNSRCEDLSSVDQIDSGANSSKEDEVDNNRGSKSDEQKRLQSCDQQVNSTSDQESTLEDGQEHSESNQDTITANTTKCDTKQSGSSLPGSIAQYRLGKSKGIESSTDTLVAELDERNGSNEVNNEMAADQGTTNDIIETSTHTHSATPYSGPPGSVVGDDDNLEEKKNPTCPPKNNAGTAALHLIPTNGRNSLDPNNSNEGTASAPAAAPNKLNGVSKKQQPISDMENGGCPAPQCLMGCDLSQYFKERIDTDGLTAHHNEVQERLMRIFATHQAEVQALRRDLQLQKLALLRQKNLISSHGVTNRGGIGSGATTNGAEELLVDIDSAARAVAGMTVGNNGVVVNGSGSSSTGACSDASSTWETVDEKEANPTLWVPDHAVAACMKCSTNFWFGRRKHHCRSCGTVVCRDCSSHMIPIPTEQLYHPVRVCDDCFVDLEKEQALNEVLTHHKNVVQAVEAVEKCELKSPN